ncbi:MAG: 3'-5' exonuclease [Streptosporangiaceae bacterium]
MSDWTSLRYAVADVEGNGQQPPDLVEVAVLPISDGAPGEPVSWLARPPRPITRLAASIHRITDADVAGAPAFAEIQPDVRRALAGRALVAHNAHVDLGVLQRELCGWQPAEVFDTLRLARLLLPGQPSYKLGALVAALSLDDGLPPGLAPHRATYDVLVTARLFVRLATRHDGTPASLEELRGQAGQSPGGSNGTAVLF